MLDLLIINPRSENIYGNLSNDLIACEPPVWCRIIAAYIRDQGYSVQILDQEALGISLKEVATLVQASNPRLICIAVYGHQPSASTQQMVGASAIATWLKNSKGTSQYPIIMVGGHVSALPEKTLREEAIDYACVGEGPVTIKRLLAEYCKSDILGLVWWGGTPTRIIINPSAPLIDMEDLHGGAWDLLPIHLYRAHNWQCLDGSPRQPYASIHTTLGCPYKCNFCLREGTLIVTKKGLNKPIEKIKAGDELLAWDETNKKIVETKVVQKSQRLVHELLKITTSSGELIDVSQEHPVYTQRGWIEAGRLKLSDQIWVMERKDKVRYLRSMYPHFLPGEMPLEARKKIAESKIGDKNPMKRPEVAAQVGVTMKERHGSMLSAKLKAQHESGIMPHVPMSEETRQAHSTRMTENNPMHDPEVVKRMQKTIKALRKEGKLTYWMETEEGKRVIGEIARVRALSDANPMKDPKIVNDLEFRALRSARMFERWADEEQAMILVRNRKKGAEHHNWQGGISKLPYPFEFNDELKLKIRTRDGHICQNCGATENLCVHHIDYVKANLDDCNLITVCSSCNVKANFVRPYWHAMYVEKLALRGLHCPHFEKIVSIEKLKGEFQVYNFECAPYDNYWAGFFLVHNCCINAPFESNQYRMRDSTEVVNEIVMLHERYGIKTFKIVDEMFILNERHYTAIAKQLIATGLGSELNIWAYARIDTVKPATLQMLRQAGFKWLALGIESGSKHVRDGAQKALKNDDIRSVVRAIQQSGIYVIGNYIFGLPDDDYESMQATLNLALELNTEYANFYSAMAYPGSKLYTEAVEKGWELPKSWEGYSQHAYNTLPLRTEKLTARQVLAFRDAAFQTYFTNPMYHNMLRYKFGESAVKQIEKMTKVVLKRKILETELV